MGDLIIITCFVLTLSYILLTGFMYMLKTNDFRAPIVSFIIFLIIIITYIMICVYNNILVKTTIECYKLGGCTEHKFQRSIIKDYELENAKNEISQKLDNKEVK